MGHQTRGGNVSSAKHAVKPSMNVEERCSTIAKHKETDILECLALLAEGVRISSISRAKGMKEDTILSFLREAAQHAQQVEAILLNDYRICQVQIDGLWTYVGRKQEKKTE
jgi:hypothetical protein